MCFTLCSSALALSNEYGFKVECYGPQLKDIKVRDGKLELTFKYGKGLHIVNNTGEKVSAGLNYLYVAGADGQFHPALSKIENGKLIAWSPEVSTPIQVKYCTEDYCKGNLYNEAGLPGYPFFVSLPAQF